MKGQSPNLVPQTCSQRPVDNATRQQNNGGQSLRDILGNHLGAATDRIGSNIGRKTSIGSVIGRGRINSAFKRLDQSNPTTSPLQEPVLRRDSNFLDSRLVHPQIPGGSFGQAVQNVENLPLPKDLSFGRSSGMQTQRRASVVNQDQIQSERLHNTQAMMNPPKRMRDDSSQ